MANNFIDRIYKIVDFNNYNFIESYTDFLNFNRYNINLTITSIYGKKNIMCCDTTASAFPLKIVEKIMERIYKYYSNTHSNNILGRIMCALVEDSKTKILNGVNGDIENDKLIFTGSGTSGAINHLVHLIRPLLNNSTVFVTVYEHYSNYLPWYHYSNKIVLIEMDSSGAIDYDKFEEQIKKTENNLIVSMTACSNVLGLILDVNKIATITHKYNGHIFVDYATSAPYVNINMHRNNNSGDYFDGIFISPHKFPGGQLTPGLLVINKKIICNDITYTPSGGTIDYFSSNIGPVYSKNIEKKENGGTPNILGIIKAGIVFQIKDHYINQIYSHELELTGLFKKYMNRIIHKCSNLVILNNFDLLSLPIFSFQIKPYHYNYIVVLLCDLFGITARGGVNCSTVLPEYLLHLNKKDIINNDSIIKSNKKLDNSYGWIRITLNCTHSKQDVKYIVNAIEYICKNASSYEKDYTYDTSSNIYVNNNCSDGICVKLSDHM